MINSALVSAQNRKRLYWVGVRQEDGSYTTANIPQPNEKDINLADILEDIGPTDTRWRPLPEKYREIVATKLIGQFRRSYLRVHSDQTHSPTLTANMGTGGNNVPVVFTIPRGKNTGSMQSKKSPTVGASSFIDNSKAITVF